MEIERIVLAGDQGTEIPCILVTPAAPIGGAAVFHSCGGSKEEMLGTAWRVAEAGLAVCVPDLRGHGENRSALDGGLLLDAERVMARCRRFGRTVAIGHSLGGRLALVATADAAIGIAPAIYGALSPRALDALRAFKFHRLRIATPL